MAGLFPFDIFDMQDPEWTTILQDTFKQWVFHGPGLWAGWSLQWAAILHARAGNGAMAERALRILPVISVTMEKCEISYVDITSTAGGTCRLKNPFPGAVVIEPGGSVIPPETRVLTLMT